MTLPAATQPAARLWTALVMWVSQLAKLMPTMHAVSHKPPAGSVSAVLMRACTGIKKCPELRNRSKSDPCSYELFCLESLILSFPKVKQIPPVSPCISNKMQRYTVYLSLKTALHVLGGISTHHQEHTTISTAPVTCQTITATCHYCGGVGTGLSVLW